MIGVLPYRCDFQVVSALSSLGDRNTKAGVIGTTASICKLIVGAGSFVLPHICLDVGYVGLSVSLLVLAALAFYTSFLVVGLKQKHAPGEDLSLSEFATRKAGFSFGFGLSVDDRELLRDCDWRILRSLHPRCKCRRMCCVLELYRTDFVSSVL